MSKRRFLSVAIISLLFGGFLASCSDMNDKPLRVGTNPWPGYAFLFLAKENGYFEEEGVLVELVELTSLGDVRKAFERGQIDGMTSSLIEVLETSRHSSTRAIVSLMTDYSNGADVFLADEAFANVAALAGHKVGIEPGTLNRFILARALAKEGLSVDDVQIINLSQDSMASALAGELVDAVVSYPPISTEIERQGGVRRVFTSADIPGEIADVVSFNSVVASTRQTEIAAFVRAWGRAVAYAEEHPQSAYEIMAPHTGLSVKELAAVYGDIHVVHGASQSAFLEPDGPLSDVMRVLSILLWPDQPELTGAELAAFFPDKSVGSSWAVGW